MATITKTKREYHGMHWLSGDEVAYPNLVPGTTAINDKSKLAFTGKLTLNFHKNSAKYNPEAVIAVYSREYPVMRERPSNNGWSRTEIVLPLTSDTYEWLLECAWRVKAHLQGVIK